jgi:hypothetical protein
MYFPEYDELMKKAFVKVSSLMKLLTPINAMILYETRCISRDQFIQ